MTEVAPQLDYARPGPRRWLRRAVILVAVVAVAAVAIRWGRAWKEHAAILLDQRRCMNYRAPADQVVYDTPRGADGIARAVKTCVSPPSWSRFADNSYLSAVVFLHARTSPSGNRRLVCLEAAPTLKHSAPSYRPIWSFRILVPHALKGPAEVLVSHFDEPFVMVVADRVYAGQADASDASHFTFEYENGGVRKTIDGWLLDDDTLKFSVREPAK